VIEAHRELDNAASRALNARLVLLANHIGFVPSGFGNSASSVPPQW
jgi:Protein of unknown function (DUF2783)